VDGGQVGVFEERDKVSFGCFLEGSDGGGLESAGLSARARKRNGGNVQISLEILSDFSD
jgi:hypothetical protein